MTVRAWNQETWQLRRKAIIEVGMGSFTHTLTFWVAAHLKEDFLLGMRALRTIGITLSLGTEVGEDSLVVNGEEISLRHEPEGLQGGSINLVCRRAVQLKSQDSRMVELVPQTQVKIPWHHSEPISGIPDKAYGAPPGVEPLPWPLKREIGVFG